ncbi:MAG TPA: M15 family metallopeptidase [Nocardioidaceae bacterium]|nr:M15 family metallopeptidase [Nocardioidaceae bacterium]
MNRLVLATVAAALLVPLTAYAEEQVNLPPVALPDAAAVLAGQSVKVPVLANDTDDGVLQPLAVVSTTGDGRVTFDASSVTFSALTTDGGSYAFDYTVSDGELTATSTVFVTITPSSGVSLTAPAKVVGLHELRLGGRVSPARVVVVRLFRRLGSGAWTQAGRTTSDSQGRFTFSERPTRLARLRFRAQAGTDLSPVLARRVVARPDLVASGPLHASDVPWSYRPGCPVGPSQLRRITVTHLTYEHRLQRGSIIVAASAVPAIRAMLTKALARRFPFRRLIPTDRYYADGRRAPTQSDLAAMRADNTSAFNCRTVTGNPYRLSQHAYGTAIDINTVRNPYVTASHVYPSFAREYLDRSHRRPGMIFRDSIVASTFRSFGWWWGARWAHPDYQHFSTNGG